LPHSIDAKTSWRLARDASLPRKIRTHTLSPCTLGLHTVTRRNALYCGWGENLLLLEWSWFLVTYKIKWDLEHHIMWAIDHRIQSCANTMKWCEPGRKLPSIGNNGGNLWRTVLEVKREFREEHAKPFLSIQLIQLKLLTLQFITVTIRNNRF